MYAVACFCVAYPLTVLWASCPGKVRGGLVVGVVLFGTASPGGLFFAFWHETVSAAACEVAFREVELEAAAHLRFNVVNLGVSEKVCALWVGYDVDSVLVLDDVAVAGFVQLQTKLVSRTSTCFDEDAQGEGRVADLFQIVLDFGCCLIGYAYCHFFSTLLVPRLLFNLEGTLTLPVPHSFTCSPSLSSRSPFPRAHQLALGLRI